MAGQRTAARRDSPTEVRRLWPEPDTLPPDELYAGLALPSGPTDRPYVVINMVSTVDGKVTVGGRASGIGSRLDRDLMRRLRAAADAVMVGAATLRAETVDPRVSDRLARLRAARGQPGQPLAITISRRLTLDPTMRFFRAGPDGALVLTTDSAPPERVAAIGARARVERVGDRDVDLSRALELLRTRYAVARLVVEGGPSLNQALFERGLVDELFWTIAPKLAGGNGPGLVHGPAPSSSVMARLTLVSLFECHDELFARYRVMRTDPAPASSAHE